jgi:tetratricopeptide (TPR) repeat protein
LRASLLLSLALLCVSSIAPCPAAAQGADAAAAPAGDNHRLLMVLPFDNRTGQASLNWIGEAASELFNQRLGSSGFQVIGRGDRQYALDHLGLPQSFQPSRATAIRLAQTLDTDDIIVGSYTLEGSTLHVSAQLLDVNALRLRPPLLADGALNQMLDVLDSLAWRVARTLDAKFPLPETSFLAAGANLHLDGFENYVRGIVELEPAERLRHLKVAVAENPGYGPAWLALGMSEFSEQHFDAAASALGHLRKSDPAALQAEFYRGLAFFYTGHYDQADEAFAFVAGQLPLPEVVNNQGVAAARRGHDGGALFQQAIASDPHDADYQFNLAIALARRGDTRNALSALGQALKLRPQDSEALSLQTQLQQPVPANVAAASAAASPATAETSARRALPLERIKRSYNDASFRQAASEMEAMEAQRIASLPAPQQAAALSKEGKTYLSRGLLLEAEREFQLALAASAQDAEAHAGLAEVRRRNGDDAQARSEAQTAIRLQPSAAAWLTLARLDRSAHQPTAEREDINRALQLEPANTDARALLQALTPAAANAVPPSAPATAAPDHP